MAEGAERDCWLGKAVAAARRYLELDAVEAVEGEHGTTRLWIEAMERELAELR